jgi:hypothetical protein
MHEPSIRALDGAPAVGPDSDRLHLSPARTRCMGYPTVASGMGVHVASSPSTTPARTRTIRRALYRHYTWAFLHRTGHALA